MSAARVLDQHIPASGFPVPLVPNDPQRHPFEGMDRHRHGDLIADWFVAGCILLVVSPRPAESSSPTTGSSPPHSLCGTPSYRRRLKVPPAKCRPSVETRSTRVRTPLRRHARARHRLRMRRRPSPPSPAPSPAHATLGLSCCAASTSSMPSPAPAASEPAASSPSSPSPTSSPGSSAISACRPNRRCSPPPGRHHTRRCRSGRRSPTLS